MTKVKFCGLRRMEDIQAANALLPDYIGFVFAPSPRQVTPELAKSLRQKLDRSIASVGVFVDAAIEDIAALCESGVITHIQLHGHEDEAYLTQLRSRIKAPIIKAIRVQSREQVLAAQALPCEYLLLDSYHDKKMGGSGKALDLSLIPPLTKPFFLAGGLDAGNVKERIAACRPYGVDVSSGVETAGFKDPEKMREFINAVYSYSLKTRSEVS
ncbi:phosphoribosylanthranilate isomerase [Oscillospiraceae bacterium MB08-C2-2]|nr:phosphoribosylanthranilate isomerase [Oscillospiraceae bacterium MB08-C2-2]